MYISIYIHIHCPCPIHGILIPDGEQPPSLQNGATSIFGVDRNWVSESLSCRECPENMAGAEGQL